MSVTHDRAFSSSANGSNGVPLHRRLRGLGPSDQSGPKPAEQSAGDQPQPSAEEELETLRRQVAAQPELLELRRRRLSPKELEAEAKLGEFERGKRRSQDKRRVKARIRREDAADRRDGKIDDLNAREEMKRAQSSAAMKRWRTRAADQAERLTSTDMRIAHLARQLAWTKRVLVGLVVVGMCWSGVNVQHNLVPSNDKADPLFWISYGVDALLLGALVILMLTSATMSRWQHMDERTTGRLGRAGGYVLEVTLTAVSLGLNTIPQMSHGDWGKAFEYGVAPLAVAVLLWVYNWSTRVLSQILAEAAGQKPLVLDEQNLELLGHVQRGFAGMQVGILRPSEAADGGGVPSASQLARHLGVSKGLAGDVRDLMKAVVSGRLTIAA